MFLSSLRSDLAACKIGSSASLDKNMSASKKLDLPAAFAPAIHVKAPKYNYVLVKLLKPSIFMRVIMSSEVGAFLY